MGLREVSKEIESLRKNYEPTSDEAVFLSIVRDMAFWASKGNWAKVERHALSVQEELESEI